MFLRKYNITALNVPENGAGSVISEAPRAPKGREGLAAAPARSRRRGRRGVRMSQRRREVLDNLRLRPRSRGRSLLSGGNLIADRNEGYPSPCRRIRHPDKGEWGGGGRLEPSSSPSTPRPLRPPSTPARHSNTQICKHIDSYNWKRRRNHGRAALKMFITLSSQRQRVYSPPAQCWTNSEISSIFLASEDTAALYQN